MDSPSQEIMIKIHFSNSVEGFWSKNLVQFNASINTIMQPFLDDLLYGA